MSRVLLLMPSVGPTGEVMRGAKKYAWMLTGIASLGSPVHAHAPYERVATTIARPDGKALTVVARYTDGIIGADPVTIIVRDPTGAKLAETGAMRDAIVRCPTYSQCRVFLYDPPFAVRPTQVLRLVDEGFVTEQSWLTVSGTFLPLWHHAGELLLSSIALAIVPAVGLLLARRRRTGIMVAVWCIFGLAAFLWLWVALLALMLNTLRIDRVARKWCGHPRGNNSDDASGRAPRANNGMNPTRGATMNARR